MPLLQVQTLKMPRSVNLTFKLGQGHASVSELRQGRRELFTHCPRDGAKVVADRVTVYAKVALADASH